MHGGEKDERRQPNGEAEKLNAERNVRWKSEHGGTPVVRLEPERPADRRADGCEDPRRLLAVLQAREQDEARLAAEGEQLHDGDSGPDGRRGQGDESIHLRPPAVVPDIEI